MLRLAYIISICTWTKGRPYYSSEPEEKALTLLWVRALRSLTWNIYVKQYPFILGFLGSSHTFLGPWHLDLPGPGFFCISSRHKTLTPTLPCPQRMQPTPMIASLYWFLSFTRFLSFSLIIFKDHFGSDSLIYISHTFWLKVSSFSMLVIVFFLRPLSFYDCHPDSSTEND